MADYITMEGLKKLQEKLNYLRDIERPEVIKRVQTAREMGDLSENAEYHAAKDEQRLLDSEIDRINRRLAIVKVIDPSTIAKDAVRFGACVTISNEHEEIENYRLVGVDEVNFSDNNNKLIYVSVASPLGAAMIGKRVDEVFVVKAPIGEKKYKVLKIS